MIDRPREWLEGLRRAAGPDADIASELLDLLDAAQGAENELEEWIREDSSALEDLKEFGELLELIESHDFTREIGEDTLVKTLEKALDLAVKYENQSMALQDLAIEAELVARNDYQTDPLPLLRMFLPVD